MYRLSDSRMGKYGFLEFIDRITVLDGDTGNDDDLRCRISHQMATDDLAGAEYEPLSVDVNLSNT